MPFIDMRAFRPRRAGLATVIMIFCACGGTESTAPAEDLTITTASLAAGLEGATYAHELEASGGDGAYSWTVASGSLPGGLALSPAGVLAGTPYTPGAYTFTVQVASGDGQLRTRQLTLDVLAELSIATSTLPPARETALYSHALSAMGGDGSYSWSATGGSLPAGLALDASGTVSGAPTVLGQQSFTVTVESGDGQSAQADVSIDVRTLTLQPGERCGEPGTSPAHVTFVDGKLETAVRQELGVSSQTALTCALVASLWGLNAGSVGIADLTGIENLVGLQFASLVDNAIADLGPLASLTLLEGLNVSGNPLDNLVPLSGLTNLRTLFAEGSQIGDITPLAGLVALEQLELAHNAIDDISALSGLPLLRVLVLHHNALSDIAPLSTATALTWLDLRFNAITDVGPLAGHDALERLYLTSNSIADVGSLSGLASLAMLDIGLNELTDIAALAETTGLTHLNVQNNAITDISAVATMSGLQNLVAISNDITDVSALAGLDSLAWVSLSVNPDLEDIQALIDNPGMGAGDHVSVEATKVACTDVAALEAKGVTVAHDCPAP